MKLNYIFAVLIIISGNKIPLIAQDLCFMPTRYNYKPQIEGYFYFNDMEYQKCHNCNKEFPLTIDFFHKNKDMPNGFLKICKDCCKKYYKKNKKRFKEYAKNNKEKIEKYQKIYRKEYYKNNIEREKERKKAYYKINKEKFIKHRQDNKEKLKEKDKKWYQNNKDHVKEYQKQHRKQINLYARNRRKVNINVRLKERLLSRVKNALKKGIKSKHTMELIGCDIDFFKNYFKSKFTKGMTWDKFMNGEIHIDHIIPCRKFDLTDIIQQLQCFNYRNLQPLWAKDNLSKNGKLLEKHAQLSLVI